MDANCREVLKHSLGDVGAVGQRLVLTQGMGDSSELTGKERICPNLSEGL